jgi:uncharacterized iron-regulated membrane protein
MAPQRYLVSGVAADLPVSAYLDAGKKAFGDRAKPSEVRLPYKPGDPVTVTGRTGGANTSMAVQGRPPSSLTAWIDPKDARVLDVADPRGGPMGLVHRLHGSLNIASAPGAGPGVGRLIVGWLGVVLAISSLTGLWLWWPRGAFRWTKLGGAFAWRRSPSTLDNLHHLVGFWLCLPLLFLSLTGMYIAFPTQSHALFGAPPPAPPRQDGGAPRDGGKRGGEHGGGHDHGPPAVSLDQAAAAALAAHPGAKLQVLTLPSGKTRAFKIAYAGSEPTVLVDAETGAVSPAPPEPVRVSDPISRWMRQTHEGEALGEWWKWLAFATGFAPTILGVTGVAVWWIKRGRRRTLAKSA